MGLVLMRVCYSSWRWVLRTNKQMFAMSFIVLGVGTETKQNKTWPWTQGVHETLNTILSAVGNQRKLNLRLKEFKI